jgi:hypothetical protein
MKIYLTFIVSLLGFLAGRTEAEYNVATNNGSITITYYSGPGGNVILPSSIDGYPVTALGAVFVGNTTVTGVTIPGTVTNIGAQAFAYCSALSNVILPNSLTQIGYQAFEYCTSLTNLILPNSITNLSLGLFYGSGLATFSIGTNVSSLGDDVFYGCTNLVALKIPDSVISIGMDECYNCTGLKNAVIGSGLLSLGTDEFYGCSALTNVTIGPNVALLDYSSFYGCTSLKTVVIPAAVTSIGSYAFSYSGLTSAYFEGNAPTVYTGTVNEAGTVDTTVFNGDTGTAYFLAVKSGWGKTFGGWPTATWLQASQPTISGASFSRGGTGNGFEFTIAAAGGTSVVVEASTNLVSWMPVATNSLVNGTNTFSDAQSQNFRNRFYRVRAQ